jgi:hypothetical protein
VFPWLCPAQDVMHSGGGALMPAVAPATPMAAPYRPLTTREKFELYTARITNPVRHMVPIPGTLIQWGRGAPEGWDRTSHGFGQRYGDRMLRFVIRDTTRFAVGALLKEDPRYFPSEDPRIMARVGSALKNTFLVRKDDGRTSLAVGRLAGNYAGGFVSNLYFPPDEATTADALRRGTLRMGGDAAINLLREFWPDIRRKLRKERRPI